LTNNQIVFAAGAVKRKVKTLEMRPLHEQVKIQHQVHEVMEPNEGTGKLDD
jgi:hypothetical protein